MTFSRYARLSARIVVFGLLFSDGFLVLSQADDDISYQRDIRPILADHCFKCHGPDAATREGSLRLDQADSALTGGDSGSPAIVAGRPDESELVRRIVSDDEYEVMPPPAMKHPLNEDQKQKLVEWIQAGGAYDEHWSFGPLTQPSTPESPASANVHNPIDAFVVARLATSTLQPNEPADRYQLVRRIHLELTGLPPTLEEADRFVQDERPDAFERRVDRLLASPHYGERMAWPWLDAARYADSNGYQGDGDRTMWPWRDWVVIAWNQDLSFDEFTRWQIAGDLLPEPSHEQQLATAFFRNHMINGEGGRIPEENRVDYVMDMSETFGTVWLGLTFNCCRCHDHKYDPLSKKDYYSLFAFFNQTPVDGSGGNPQTPPVLNAPSESQAKRVAQLQSQIENQRTHLRTWLAENQPESTEGQSQETVSVEGRSPGQWDQWLKENPELPEEVAGWARQLIADMKALEATEGSIPKVMIMADRSEVRPTFLLNKGLYNQPENETTPATPERFSGLPEGAFPNRLGLAQWLLSDDQPLMARVTTNRLWQQIFGVGLVKTVEDFGTQGEWPSHPELLDWISAEYRDRGWSTKRLVRRIVLSATYRQSSSISSTATEWDPENRLLSHGPRFRMPSWMIRDQALAASGLLDDRVGGTPVFPYQPSGVWQEATFGNRTYRQSEGSDLYRRSLYTFWRRIVAPTLFFDSASRQTCTVNNSLTNTPLHALATLNDITYVEASRVLAQDLQSSQPDASPQEWLSEAFRRILIRPPSQEELQLLLKSYQELSSHYQEQPAEAELLVNVGQLPIVDIAPQRLAQAAALAAVCNGLFNVDEALTKE